MDLEYTPEEQQFRDELRTVFYEKVPAEIRERVVRGQISREDIVTSQRILHEHGLAVPHWPTQWGGKKWSATQQNIYVSELQRAAVPTPLAFNVSMVGPIIAEFGSQEQKEKFLPATANLDIWWSQGFSEPEAGSDLAGLKTTAIRDGDEYVINGQKTWTTLGQYGDWMFLLARTNPGAERKQQGISFILVDMQTPGIERRPIKLIDGSVEVNEFFFDNVRVPVSNLVGEENKGWTYAKFLLGNERNGIAQVGTSQRVFAELVDAAKETDVEEGTLAEDPDFRAQLHTAKMRLLALEATQLRVAGASADGKPDPASSLLKLEGTRLLQSLTALRLDAGGTDSVLVGDTEGTDGTPVGLSSEHAASTAALQYLNMRKLSIFGGSNEIQRGVIAKAVLGL
ncbi:acyl-CoA dehydrogenase family protein [Allobranchiibius sp. CTAmp26]|uniref:acyl-CoA dehydrogenase family protein n=1 Tax=Allobranchiibius sp. CTAmp26 TaxID=2815214 RepID=UPI001AA10038|nr:acyl-CoA dehydrogenase family protein [Allobranchiibius sp. CTAmp26]MBO1754691.1 acyl-CoA dehydrogenase family protein [Allobranchiibius sp. CTAmp26]